MPLRPLGLPVRSFHALRLHFPVHSSHRRGPTSRSYYPARAETRTVWALPRSLATTWGIILYFLFLQVMRCFSSLRWPTVWCDGTSPAGLPHSEIPGSKVICTYPGLIAAYHVLRRLLEPRHPPCALLYFPGSSAQASPPTRWTELALQISSSLSLLVSTICQRS